MTMSSVRLVHAAISCAAVGVAPTSAQSPPARATLTHVEGAVYLDDQLITAPSGAVVLGDSVTIRTAGGRAVVALERGGVLVLDEQTLIRVLANRVYDFKR